MNVRLVSITKSLVDGKELSAEQLLVYIARVSNPSNQLNTETADKLLGFLIKSRHWSPFDMINMTVEVTTSRAIAHQILRHWSIKPQEFSQRYAEAVSFEPVQLRKKADKNRQSSVEEINPWVKYVDGNDVRQFGEARHAVANHIVSCQNLYKELLAQGVATECARFVLPLCTSTTMYLNGSVRTWIHYMEQRCDEHAQLEHQQVAIEIKKIFIQNFPSISTALGF